VDSVAAGQNCDVALTLRLADGRAVFLKGVDGVSRRMRWLRNEIAAGELAPGVAPGVVFHEDVGSWLVVGFEHVTGRAASLAPGSADLPLIASTVDRIGAMAAPGLRPLSERWRDTGLWHRVAELAPDAVTDWDVDAATAWADQIPELVHGDRLVHTDLHSEQFLVNGEQVHVIDWGWPATGAPWVDTAFLVMRLIGMGHEPAAAEAWARTVPSWSALPSDTITAFAVHVAGLWSYRAATERTPCAAYRANLARDYATWRLAA
jgi:hypothetical protein